MYAYAKYLERTIQPTIVEKEKLEGALTKAKPMEPFNVLILGADYRQGRQCVPDRHDDRRARRSQGEEGLAAVDPA